MSSMARTTSSSSSCLKGFSILQPTMGAPLSWMPAVGTQELEQLINAYLPGPGSAQEKRAALSIDFFEYSAQTGESFRYYPVNSAVASSPAASSSFASPAMSDLTYSGSSPSQASTPAPNMAHRAASRKSPAKTETTDSSHLPGMKILTIDGQDVTNSVSRGCKTKEQREHAHLMRVLKACDACKRKKIRCDPSHKRRTSSQAKPEASTKPAAKRVKKSPPATASQAAAFTPVPDVSLDMDMAAFDSFPAVDQLWDEFLTFNDDAVSAPVPQDFYGAVPQDFDFFFGQETQFSPTISGSSGSFDSPAQPLTPDNSHVLPQVDFSTFTDDNTLAFTQAGGQEPVLPYMAPGGAHGSNYVDFSLYSPASSFIDEEPQKLRAGSKRKASALQTDLSAGSNATSLGSLDEPLMGSGLARDQQWCSDHGFASLRAQNPESRVPGGQHDVISGQLGGGSACLGSQLPFHADNAGQGRTRAATTTTSNGRPVQQPVSGGNSPVTSAALLEDRERDTLLPQSPGLGSPATVTPSSSPSLRVRSLQAAVQQDIVPVAGNALEQSQTVSPTVLQAADTNRLRSDQQGSNSSTALPLSTAVVSTSLDRQGAGSLHGGLLSAGRLLPADGRHALLPVNAAANSGSATPVVVASHNATAAHPTGPVSGSGPSQVLLRSGEAILNGNVTAVALASRATTGPSPSPSPSPRVSNHGQQRQLLHGATILASAASSSPLRLPSGEDVVAPTHSPVRQLPGRSNWPAQLVAFGLVSMLLIVAITSQLQRHAPTIFAHLLSASISMIILSLLSTLPSALQQRACSSPLAAAAVLGKSSAGHALDGIRSLLSHSRVAAPCRDRSAWIGPARVPVACF